MIMFLFSEWIPFEKKVSECFGSVDFMIGFMLSLISGFRFAAVSKPCLAELAENGI